MLPRNRTAASVDPDDAIRATDDDAAASRLSAINVRYLSDPFTSALYRPPRNAAGPSRKPPLINVGTHHRTVAIDKLVYQFLEVAGGQAQIVSLGAGSDSRFWRIRSRNGKAKIRYVEVDFPHVTSLKAQRISRSPQLISLLDDAQTSPAPSFTAVPVDNSATSNNQPMAPPTIPPKPFTVHKGGTQLVSPLYSLIPLDLRAPSTSLQSDLLPHLDPHVPTLFLAECVFCYMNPGQSEDIIKWFGTTFDSVVGVAYEMCGLNDTFGQVMRRNLASRQLSIPGSEPFSNPTSQAARFLAPSLASGKFDVAGAKSLWEIRESVIGKEELRRIAKLEILDEIEELRLVLSHYCVAWGTKGTGMDRIGL